MALDLRRLVEEAEKQIMARICTELAKVVERYRANPILWPIVRDVLRRTMDKYLKECGVEL